MCEYCTRSPLLPYGSQIGHWWRLWTMEQVMWWWSIFWNNVFFLFWYWAHICSHVCSVLNHHLARKKWIKILKRRVIRMLTATYISPMTLFDWMLAQCKRRQNLWGQQWRTKMTYESTKTVSGKKNRHSSFAFLFDFSINLEKHISPWSVICVT